MKIETIGIIGLGYVGLPLAEKVFLSGLTVIGFDHDDIRVKDINTGSSPICSISDENLLAMGNKGFIATTEMSKIGECDMIILCLPTPLDNNRQPDLSYITNTLNNIAPFLKENQILSLESTTWPGTTREIIAPIIEMQGFTVGQNFFLVYSPEREDPGNKKYDTKNIPKVIGGLTKNCLEAGKKIYANFIDILVPVSSLEIAELSKLTENIYRAVNIGLVNELKILCDAMSIDVREVLDAAATKPFGFESYSPGPGIGGHCIPVDPFYLTWRVKKFGVESKFIEVAGEINNNMPNFVVKKTIEGLNRYEKSIKNSRILMCGIAYKKDVDDARESPAIEIIHLLEKWGAKVEFCDPFFDTFPHNKKRNVSVTKVEINQESIKDYDAVIIATDHTSFNYEMIINYAKLVIDTRGIYRKNYHNLVKS